MISIKGITKFISQTMLINSNKFEILNEIDDMLDKVYTLNLFFF